MARLMLRGEVLAPGISSGTLRFIDPEKDVSRFVNTERVQNIDLEIMRLEREVEAVVGDLYEAVNLLRLQSYNEEAEIVQTHIYMLKDETFRRKIREHITMHGTAAEIALERVLQEMGDLFEGSQDLTFSEKAADIRDIVLRLKRKLARKNAALFENSMKGVASPVVATRELLPSQVLEAKVLNVRAFIVNAGTPLSHAAILAKSFGIPVLKVTSLNGVEEGEEVALDAYRGIVYVRPDTAEVHGMTAVRSGLQRGGGTKVPVHIWVNIVEPQQLEKEMLDDIDGIGLFRTEFLFMKNADTFPTEDEQYEVYADLCKRYRGIPITVRTLDIGSDKTPSHFSFGPQQNPSLGLRAHRVYRYHPELFKDQMRALLRAAVNTQHLRILYPMIESVDDLVFIKRLLREVLESLVAEDVPHQRVFQEGVLIEVPSAAWHIHEMLALVDFASIGTNDLLQYYFAVDRNNANVYRSDYPENPATLRLLQTLVHAANTAHKPLSICGEIASNLRYLPIILGLGFENVSIDSHAVGLVRDSLSVLDPESCARLVEKCLASTRTVEITRMLDAFHAQVPGREDSPYVDNESRDPVCRMIVHTEGNRLRVREGERTYYFCSRTCRDTFLRDRA
jgi:phosphoenolpyruvate-protein phosphotransferase